MTIHGVEPVVTALTAALESGLPAVVAAINTTYDDGYRIEAPAQVLDYMPLASELQDFPVVAIEHGPLKWLDDTGFEATGQIDLIVCAFVAHDEPRGLTKTVERYMLALHRTIFTNTRTLGVGNGHAWGITHQGGDFGPAVARKLSAADSPPSSFWTWCAVGVRCKYDEA